MNKRRNCRQLLLDDELGSLSLAITSLFLLTLLLSFSIVDISGAYLAKRELINAGEAALSRATHHLDTDRYYAGSRTQVGESARGPAYLLPIDCSAAERSLHMELAATSLQGAAITPTSFRCDGDQIWISISAQVRPMLSLPILQGSVMNDLLTISADLNAGNLIG